MLASMSSFRFSPPLAAPAWLCATCTPSYSLIDDALDPVRTSVSTRTPPSPLPPPPTALATPDRRRSIPPSLVRYQPSPDPTSPATRPGAKRPSSGEDLTPLAKRPLCNLPVIGAKRGGHLVPPHVDTTPVSPCALPTLPHALLATQLKRRGRRPTLHPASRQRVPVRVPDPKSRPSHPACDGR